MRSNVDGTVRRSLTLLAFVAIVALGRTTASAATFIVTNLNDSGTGSFRQAFNDARRDDTIEFAVTGTITLTTFSLSTAAVNLKVRGPGADRLTINGNGLFRVFDLEASVTMSGLTIRNGDTTRQTLFNRRGAGIYNTGLLVLNDCVIVDNSGGAIHNSGFMEINRCTIASNTASSDRGNGETTGISRAAAIVNDGSTLTVSHSTIANNEGRNDLLTNEAGSVVSGGILHLRGALQIIGCTISGNRVSGGTGFPAGGGIANLASGTPTVRDTLIAGNTSASAPDCYGSFTSGGYNLIGDKAQSTGFGHGVNRDQVGGAGRAVIDPKLGALGKNGGTTPTMALLAGSPAIDQGLSSLPTDQRGADRRSDFSTIANVEGGDGSDVGAFELSATPSALLNISTRAQVQQNDNVLIGGFIVSGSDAKKVLLRAIGPSLSSKGVQGALQNPTLELFQGDTRIANNDDWKQSQQAEIEATGIPPTNDAESAIVRTLAAGSYTAIVRGVNNETGIALVEAYDLDQSAKSALDNISTRAFVQTDEKVLIGGIIVGPAGSVGSRVLVRALGPSLAGSGVSGPLQDPTLELFDGNGAPVAANDNWKQTQQAEIGATGIPPSDDREAAIVQSLAAGNYTAVVRGKDNTMGVALVEAYNLR
ncbi:MAG TPA: choice-of-anchor Q domain-containing protein [Chthoniobacterales bacterium]|nr:choice-of-anchor Q domain-containing protein [Chthoniobacterales bacterium]